MSSRAMRSRTHQKDFPCRREGKAGRRGFGTRKLGEGLTDVCEYLMGGGSKEDKVRFPLGVLMVTNLYKEMKRTFPQ